MPDWGTEDQDAFTEAENLDDYDEYDEEYWEDDWDSEAFEDADPFELTDEQESMLDFMRNESAE